MQDTIIKNNGKLHKLKFDTSEIDSTNDFMKKLKNDELTADVLVDTEGDGFEVLGTPNNKANLLSKDTAEKIFGEDSEDVNVSNALDTINNKVDFQNKIYDAIWDVENKTYVIEDEELQIIFEDKIANEEANGFSVYIKPDISQNIGNIFTSENNPSLIIGENGEKYDIGSHIVGAATLSTRVHELRFANTWEVVDPYLKTNGTELLFEGATKGSITLNNIDRYSYLVINMNGEATGVPFGNAMFPISMSHGHHQNITFANTSAANVHSTYMGQITLLRDIETNQATLTISVPITNVVHNSGSGHGGASTYYIRTIEGCY